MERFGRLAAFCPPFFSQTKERNMSLFADVASSATNPALGIMIFALGGLAGAIFYLPFKKVRSWAWESYWMVYAIFGLVVMPWIMAFTTSPNVLSVQGAGLLLHLRSDVGLRRIDLGTYDSLLGRRPRLGHRRRAMLGDRYAHPPNP
jgi:hypothetical protein